MKERKFLYTTCEFKINKISISIDNLVFFYSIFLLHYKNALDILFIIFFYMQFIAIESYRFLDEDFRFFN